MIARAPGASAGSLLWAVQFVQRARGDAIDALKMDAAERALASIENPLICIEELGRLLDLQSPKLLQLPDPAFLPLVAFVERVGWGVITERRPEGHWIFRTAGGTTAFNDFARKDFFVRLGAKTPASRQNEGRPVALIRREMAKCRGVMTEGIVASVFINVLAIAMSLFSMQVYDRVIPARSDATLAVLLSGVLLLLVVETALKFARSRIMKRVTVRLDETLSRDIFQRLLNVRIDQMPGSVGSLAGQLRGYEQVRAYLTARTLFSYVDIPMAFIFILLMGVIGSPLIAALPLLFGIVAMVLGVMARRRIHELAAQGAQAANLRTGLLVEAVEGAETIKAGAGGWKFLSRWLDLGAKTLANDLKMQAANEGLQYWAAALQQVNYVCVVALGAVEAISGNISSGSVMACSILAGRVFAPILGLPGLIVSHSHAKAALTGLDKLYALQTDQHNVLLPLTPSALKGSYYLQEVSFSYPERVQGITIDQLRIEPGERVAVVGPIGAGKSTLLRLLAGLYRPVRGRVLVDGLDLSQIDRQIVSEQIGYLQQDHRLFQGTLKENLLIGMPDPGDDAIQKVMLRTGMAQVVAAHPRGLQMQINEGGTGLSGGQRQLVAFTRLLLCEPNVFLLDEPTASMDDGQEQRCIQALSEELAHKKSTFLVVTHKRSMLALVDRLIFVAGHRIVFDGPRDEVIQKLAAQAPAKRQEAKDVVAPAKAGFAPAKAGIAPAKAMFAPMRTTIPPPKPAVTPNTKAATPPASATPAAPAKTATVTAASPSPRPVPQATVTAMRAIPTAQNSAKVEA